MIDKLFDFDTNHDVGAGEAGNQILKCRSAQVFKFVPCFAGVRPVTGGNAEKMFDGLVRINGGDLIEAG